MARKYVITDDLDDSPDATEFKIGWEGEWRVIALSKKNLAAFTKNFDPYWDKASKDQPSAGPGRRRGTGGGGAKRQSNYPDYDRDAYKQWADSKGIEIGRGRQPIHRIEQFLQETG